MRVASLRRFQSKTLLDFHLADRRYRIEIPNSSDGSGLQDHKLRSLGTSSPETKIIESGNSEKAEESESFRTGGKLSEEDAEKDV